MPSFDPALRRTPLALLAAAASLLVGCGGGGGSDAAAPPPSAASGATHPLAGSPAATCGLSNFEAELLDRVNARRAAGASCGTHGAFAATGALAWSDALAVAAVAHSDDMATRNYFAHTAPDGTTPADRASAAGYAWRVLAENIAAGQSSIAQVVDGWMASDGHCANIMDAALRDIGVACVASTSADYPTYWTMDLGAPR
jgi:uncharacterized protein YkwD